MRTLQESIMDGEEVVMSDLDNLIRVKEFHTKLRKRTPKELDMVNQPLQVGDLVIASNRGQPMPGVIMKIRSGNYAICFTGTLMIFQEMDLINIEQVFQDMKLSRLIKIYWIK